MSSSVRAMRVVREISQSQCIALLLLAGSILSAQTQECCVRNIILVHGARADGSRWKGVCDILVKDGYNVSIVQEPETSLKKTWLLPGGLSLSKTDRAFLSLTAMGEP